MSTNKTIEKEIKSIKSKINALITDMHALGYIETSEIKNNRNEILDISYYIVGYIDDNSFVLGIAKRKGSDDIHLLLNTNQAVTNIIDKLLIKHNIVTHA